MQTYSRRQLFQFAAGAAAAAGTGQLFGKATAGVPEQASRKPLRLGLLVKVSDDPEKVMAQVHELGLPTAHVMIWDFSPAMAARLRGALDRYEVEATVLYSSGPGEEKYDLVDGPPGFGLIPTRYRRQRIDQLKRASDFAKRVGVPALFNQWGFIPEVPSDPLYEPTVEAVREIAGHCKGNGQMFFNETGQETPITLLRTIQDAGIGQPGAGSRRGQPGAVRQRQSGRCPRCHRKLCTGHPRQGRLLSHGPQASGPAGSCQPEQQR